MPAVKRALAQLTELDLRLWSEDTGPAIRVDRGGSVVVLSEPDVEGPHRQRVLPQLEGDLFDVLGVFEASEGTRGPDLHSPRPTLAHRPGQARRLAARRAYPP
jgi:hypothetical protein